jgi:GNAT superfamily N-acetyltransferase
MVRIFPNVTDLQPILALWNTAMTDLRFKLDLAALESRFLNPDDTHLEFQNDLLAGFVCIANPAKPYRLNDTTGHVRLLAVHPDFQRRGIGSRLLTWAETTLKARGATRVVVGTEAHHFFPGIPLDFHLPITLEIRTPENALLEFFARRGFEISTGVSNDLARELNDLPKLELPKNARIVQADVESVLEFIRREFPGRWVYDTNFVLQQAEHQHLVLEVDGRVMGFALIGLRSDPVILPSSFWLTEDCGLGPMGVSSTLRGQGLGFALLVAAMHKLKSRGGTRMGIDWTGVQGFYQKAGFEVVRRYRHAVKTLN